MEVSESSSGTSAEPPSEKWLSANSIDDQLDALSLQPNDGAQIRTDNDGDRDAANFEGRENEENLQANEVAIVMENEKVDENDGGIEMDREIEVVGGEEREDNRRIKFPVRPEVEDCSFYLKTGTCKFGMNCKFNHPPNRKSQGGKVKGKDESLDGAAQKMKEKDDSRAEQIDCKYFDRPGGCKFGKACKFNHIRKTASSSELNFMGLPIRPGEKECPFYMRTSSCKFGANCKFDHPDPTSTGGSDIRLGNSNGGSILSPNALQSTLGSWSPAALSESPSYVPLMFPPAQNVPPQPEWHAYQAPVFQPERSMQQPPSAYATNNQPPERNAYTHQQILLDEFPERPGQPECSYFVKTGNCKFRSACKFHHPKKEGAKPNACTLSNLGLPLRPGQSVCSYYSRYGICKFGPACKYDHPINYDLSAPTESQNEDVNSASGDSVENDQATVPPDTEVPNEN